MEPLVVDENDLIPRAERPNPFNYTEMEFAERDKAVADMLERHPTIPPKWCEWMWDTWKRKGEEEMMRIINSGEWDKPIYERNTGGVISDAMEIIAPTHTPEELGEMETDQNGELILKE